MKEIYYFYDDERYTDWVAMEGFLPATKTGGEALAASEVCRNSWITFSQKLLVKRYHISENRKWTGLFRSGPFSVYVRLNYTK